MGPPVAFGPEPLSKGFLEGGQSEEVVPGLPPLNMSATDLAPGVDEFEGIQHPPAVFALIPSALGEVTVRTLAFDIPVGAIALALWTP